MPNPSEIALDISNYTGELNSRELEWIQANCGLVIVRLSTEDGGHQREIAAQQVGALSGAGIPWQGYLWAYHYQEPFVHWQRAQEMLPAAWPGYYGSSIWIDHEDPADPATDALTWQNAYASLLRADGFAPGVYTGAWWIKQHRAAFTAGREAYWRQYPLWFANYSVPPSETPPSIAPWHGVAMHQYASIDAGPVLRSYDLSLIVKVA